MMLIGIITSKMVSVRAEITGRNHGVKDLPFFSMI